MRRIRTNAPSQLFFLTSLVIAVIALLAAITTFILLPIAPFWLMTIAYVILAAGSVMRNF